MAQQTAVEWLKKEISNEDYHTEGELGNSCIDINTLLTLLEQTKAMEKEQLENARPQIISNCVIKEILNEEIWNASIEYDNRTIQETPMVHFQQGAFWYREQLKNSVHGT